MFYSAMLCVGIALSFGMVLKIGPIDFVHRLANTPIHWIILSILFYALVLLLGICRWAIYLRTLGVNVSIKELRYAYFLNCFISNLTPARSGDLLVPKYLSDSVGISASTSSAMLIVERLGDLIVIAASATVSFVVLIVVYDVELPVSLSPATFMISIVLILIGHFVVKEVLANSARCFLARLSSEIISGVSVFLTAGRIFLVILLSALNWSLHIGKEFFFLVAFISIGLGEAMVNQSVSMILSLVSFVPGGVGVNVASTAIVTKSMGLDWEGAAVSVTTSTLLYSLIRFALGIYFFKNRRSHN